MSIRSRLAVGAAALCALGAIAASAAADARAPCFFISQWQGWHAPNAHTIYLRVNMRDIYRVDLSAGSQMLTWPGSYHLVSRVEGSSSICGPLDLQLALSDGHGFYQPLIAKDLVKLTPAQITALPKKDLP
ncbi:MAG: DUF6491 family protein [Caulobacteraceae bacterium]